MKKIISCIFGLLMVGVFFQGISSIYANDDITSSSFQINVGDVTPGGTSLIGSGAGKTIGNFLGMVLEKLILVFGVFSVFIMTIGGGYMIIYHGQDEFLSKGKSIFMAGIISLAVALSAGLIVKVFTFLLYS